MPSGGMGSSGSGGGSTIPAVKDEQMLVKCKALLHLST